MFDLNAFRLTSKKKLLFTQNMRDIYITNS